MRHTNGADLETRVSSCRPDSYVRMHVVEGAGHHVHCNKPEEFNEIVNSVCSLADCGGDQGAVAVPPPPLACGVEEGAGGSEAVGEAPPPLAVPS